MRVSAALLLVALSGGYAFSTILLPSRYFSARENGHRAMLVGESHALILSSTLPLAFLLSYSVNLVFRVPRFRVWLLTQAIADKDFEKSF